MTARQVFEATLIELSKIQAPALKLYEFNYLLIRQLISISIKYIMYMILISRLQMI